MDLLAKRGVFVAGKAIPNRATTTAVQSTLNRRPFCDGRSNNDTLPAFRPKDSEDNELVAKKEQLMHCCMRAPTAAHYDGAPVTKASIQISPDDSGHRVAGLMPVHWG